MAMETMAYKNSPKKMAYDINQETKKHWFGVIDTLTAVFDLF